MNIILLILALIVSTNEVLAVTRCTDTNPCKNEVINDNKIKCIAASSCAGSSLTATNTITCKGVGSCQNSEGLIAENNIICSGGKSCFKPNGNITSISGDVNCVSGYSCSLGINAPAVKSVISGRNVKCFGNRACMHAIVQATGDVRISGYMSCPKGCRVTAGGDITVQDDASEIRGTLTATNINVIGGWANYAKFTVSNKVLCKSEYGCVGAVYIQSSGNSLEVEFKGMASGYGSNVYCPSSGNCTIQCSNNGAGCSSNRTTGTGWGNTIIYYNKNTNLNVIPASCGPNRANRNIDQCPEFQRDDSSEDEYNEMIRMVVEKADAEEEEYEYDDFEEMVFASGDKNEFLSATQSSYLDMNMVNGFIAVGMVGIIIGVLVICCQCYGGGDKYEIIE